MVDLNSVEAVVYDAVDELNATLATAKLEKSHDTALFGRGSVIDSIGLVNFVVTLEQLLDDKFQVALTLADERAMSQKNSPFRTLGSLITYVHARLLEAGQP